MAPDGMPIPRRAAHFSRPPLEQVEVWRRHDMLRDYLAAHGRPPPAVNWMRETLAQRLTRITRRNVARQVWANAAVRLEGLGA